jgi:hypothetical protein
MVGIDVASEHVDVAAIGAELPASLARVSNDTDGHSKLADGLVRLAPGLVLLEATGGYEAAPQPLHSTGRVPSWASATQAANSCPASRVLLRGGG